MRKLQTSDAFLLARIIKQANIKQTMSDVIKAKSEDTNVESLGIDIVMTIVEACGNEKIEVMLYDLLAGITERAADDVKSQSIEVTIEQISQIIKENNISNFFKLAGRLTT